MALQRKKEYIIEESSEEEKEIFNVKETPKKSSGKVGGAPKIKKSQPQFGLGDILSTMKATAGRAKFEESDESDEEDSVG